MKQAWGTFFKVFATFLGFPVSLATKTRCMKKIILFCWAVVLFSTVTSAQAYEGNIEYNKKNHPPGHDEHGGAGEHGHAPAHGHEEKPMKKPAGHSALSIANRIGGLS